MLILVILSMSTACFDHPQVVNEHTAIHVIAELAKMNQCLLSHCSKLDIDI
jgi:hypothetical protein